LEFLFVLLMGKNMKSLYSTLLFTVASFALMGVMAQAAAAG